MTQQFIELITKEWENLINLNMNDKDSGKYIVRLNLSYQCENFLIDYIQSVQLRKYQSIQSEKLETSVSVFVIEFQRFLIKKSLNESSIFETFELNLNYPK